MLSQVQFFFRKLYKKWPVLTFDCLAIPVAWYLAFWLRYNLKAKPPLLLSTPLIEAFCILFTIQVLSFYYCKVYRGLWRFSSIDDVFRIIKSVSLAIFVALPSLYLCSFLVLIPRSIFPLYCLILISFLCAGRLLMRQYQRLAQREFSSSKQKVLIIGAGEAGESLVRDLKKNGAYCPVGYLDDDPKKWRLEIHGLPVLGSTRDLKKIAAQYQIALIFIAIPSLKSVAMRRIVNFCEDTHLPFRTLPSLKDLVKGHVAIQALREVSLEDLLGRDEVQLEWPKIAEVIENSNILVTGGGGSIGSELCRQILGCKPKRLMIVDNSDHNLYQIELECKTKFPEQHIDFILASITDKVAMEEIFVKGQPKLVFHAAAFKHVPMLEKQVRSAVLNNIIGTQIVAELAIAFNVEKFIFISTDKAVNPANIMGVTKRIAEIYCQNANALRKTQFITVRFGNVLGSNGSVLPLFKKQLEAGGPITVTHPEIERYFMTIPEACRLILQAMANSVGGEIFVLDMGVPIKISYLAEQLIRLAGKEPNKDIAIVYTGLRPGEKLFEELFHKAETLTPTPHSKLFKASIREWDWENLMLKLNTLHIACQKNDIQTIDAIFDLLVPEYQKVGMPELEV